MKNTFKNFGPIYVINLKRREDRRQHMESEFKKHNIKNYQFFEAVDGSDESIKEKIICNNLPISNNELACGMSHLYVIKHWLETSNSEYAIIMEDDTSFETVQYWPWTWEEFLDKIQEPYNMLQLAITNTRPINKTLHLREFFDSCANCYLITRQRAEELIKSRFVDDKIIFSEDRNYAVPEGIYTMAMCYSFPLFTYIIDESDLSKDRQINAEPIHIKSRNEVINFWKTKPKNIYKRLGNNKNG